MAPLSVNASPLALLKLVFCPVNEKPETVRVSRSQSASSRSRAWRKWLHSRRKPWARLPTPRPRGPLLVGSLVALAPKNSRTYIMDLPGIGAAWTFT